MGEARRKTINPSMSPAAKQLLTAIAQAQRAAIAVKEPGGDDLPGEIGDFVLIYPDGRMRVVADDFMRRAALLLFTSRRFVPGKSPPKPKRSDLPRAERLIVEMRLALSAGHIDVIGPPNADGLLNSVSPFERRKSSGAFPSKSGFPAINGKRRDGLLPLNRLEPAYGFNTYAGSPSRSEYDANALLFRNASR